MRKVIFLLLVILLSLVSYAQNPYVQFGYYAPQMPRLEANKVEEFNPHVFVIVNKESAFDIGRLEIDQTKGLVTCYSQDNVLLAFDTLDGYSSLRWLSPDPMGQHNSPYLAMSNNPVSSTDLSGGWDDNKGITYYVDGYRVSASQFGLQYNSATNGSIEAYGSAFGGIPQYTYQNKSGMFGFWSPGYATGEIGRDKDGNQTSGVVQIVQQFNRLMDKATYEALSSQAAENHGTEIKKGKKGLATQLESLMDVDNSDVITAGVLKVTYGLFNDIHKYLTGLVGERKNISGRIDYSASGRKDAGNGLVTLASFGMSVAVRGVVLGEAVVETKYIGRLEDLKRFPRSQTMLDDLPNLGNPKANYYQNMSVLRKTLREGYTIRDASSFRPNSELAPTLLNPNRTVGQTFLGAERNLLNNRGLWP